MAEGDRYFFVHLMKTAGTVVNVALRRAVGRNAVYPGPDHDAGPAPTIDVAGLVARWPELRATVRVVAGHFPYATAARLEPGLRMFTVLRDPVDRTLSLLRVELGKRPEGDDWTLADVYEREFLPNPLAADHMTRMLGTTADEMPHGLLSPVDLTPAHVDRAVDRLEAMDVVGFQDDLPAFGAALRRAYGWDLPDFGRGNVSAPAPTPPGLRERIAADSALDVDLYRRARAALCGGV